MGFDFEIDVDNLYPEVWFGDKPGKRVCLRLCSPEKIEEFRKECTKVTKTLADNKRMGAMQIVKDTEFDDNKFARLLNEHCIVDWDLTDVKGDVIPCNANMKVKMMGVIPFSKFVNEGIKELTKQAGIEAEEEVKNFEPSQDGS
jgi:hypothetical protein